MGKRRKLKQRKSTERDSMCLLVLEGHAGIGKTMSIELGAKCNNLSVEEFALSNPTGLDMALMTAVGPDVVVAIEEIGVGTATQIDRLVKFVAKHRDTGRRLNPIVCTVNSFEIDAKIMKLMKAEGVWSLRFGQPKQKEVEEYVRFKLKQVGVNPSMHVKLVNRVVTEAARDLRAVDRAIDLVKVTLDGKKKNVLGSPTPLHSKDLEVKLDKFQAVGNLLEHKNLKCRGGTAAHMRCMMADDMNALRVHANLISMSKSSSDDPVAAGSVNMERWARTCEQMSDYDLFQSRSWNDGLCMQAAAASVVSAVWNRSKRGMITKWVHGRPDRRLYTDIGEHFKRTVPSSDAALNFSILEQSNE